MRVADLMVRQVYWILFSTGSLWNQPFKVRECAQTNPYSLRLVPATALAGRADRNPIRGDPCGL